MYELYREKYRIVERRDDAVYRTEKVDEGWYPEEEVQHPSDPDTMYVVVGSDHPRSGQLTIRKVR